MSSLIITQARFTPFFPGRPVGVIKSFATPLASSCCMRCVARLWARASQNSSAVPFMFFVWPSMTMGTLNMLESSAMSSATASAARASRNSAVGGSAGRRGTNSMALRMSTSPVLRSTRMFPRASIRWIRWTASRAGACLAASRAPRASRCSRPRRSRSARRARCSPSAPAAREDQRSRSALAWTSRRQPSASPRQCSASRRHSPSPSARAESDAWTSRRSRLPTGRSSCTSSTSPCSLPTAPRHSAVALRISSVMSSARPAACAWRASRLAAVPPTSASAMPREASWADALTLPAASCTADSTRSVPCRWIDSSSAHILAAWRSELASRPLRRSLSWSMWNCSLTHF
mmetsp:Transcript_57729/g.162816  ORF Transcript_57729/g.162816 Transcript_57729/m.162816 type:complete len:348 (+) Transcript_57729:35-1078(+)